METEAKVDKKFLACPCDFYDHVKECRIENEELERIICGENSLDSGFYEICYAFARCAEEQSTYTPEQQLNAIDKLRELIAIFCRKNSYTADSALIPQNLRLSGFQMQIAENCGLAECWEFCLFRQQLGMTLYKAYGKKFHFISFHKAKLKKSKCYE